MSTCSQLSDISEFAAWEVQHPSQVHELSREQSILDMAAPERIWRGEDSSNDARSEDGKGTADKNEEVVRVQTGSQRSVKDGSQKSVNGKESSQTAKQSSQAHEVDSVGQSQSLQGDVKKVKGKTGIPSSTQTSLKSSQSLKSASQKSERESSLKSQSPNLQGRSLGPDFDAPPSSQPRGDSESEEEEEEEQEDEDVMDVNDVGEKSSADELNTCAIKGEKPSSEEVEIDDEEQQSFADEFEDDALDGFDVAPEQKEFLKELLPYTSQQELGLLQKAKDDAQYSCARRLSSFEDEMEFLEYLKTSVHDFAKEHPFWAQTQWSEEDMSEFEDDVHAFATAAGMRPHQAQVEVMRALGAWKQERGLPIAGSTTAEDHKELDAEMILASVVQITQIPDKKSRKRKRNEKATESVPAPVEDGVDEASQRKRQKKENRKARRKAKKQKEKLGAVLAPEASVSNQKLNLLSSQDWYSNSAAKETTPSPLPKAVPISVVEGSSAPKISAPATTKNPVAQASTLSLSAKRRRKKAKQGPVNSAYFPAAAAAIQAQVAKNAAVTRPAPESPVVTAHEPSDAVKKMAQAAREALENALKTTENRQKRKKKRNNNKLPEEQARDLAVEKKEITESGQTAEAEVKTREPSKISQRKRKDKRTRKIESELLVQEGNEAAAVTAALPSKSNVNDVTDQKDDGTNKKSRRDRGRKVKFQQEGDASAQNTSIGGTVTINATEAKSDELPAKQEGDQDVASNSKDEEIKMAEAEAEGDEPRKKRSRRVRKSKADWEKEQVEVAQSADGEPVTVEAKNNSNFPEMPKVEAKYVDITESESTEKQRRYRRKSERKQQDIEVANPDEALTELANTNSEKKHKKDKKNSGRKSIDAMDLDTKPAEESKVSHS